MIAVSPGQVGLSRCTWTLVNKCNSQIERERNKNLVGKSSKYAQVHTDLEILSVESDLRNELYDCVVYSFFSQFICRPV